MGNRKEEQDKFDQKKDLEKFLETGPVKSLGGGQLILKHKVNI